MPAVSASRRAAPNTRLFRQPSAMGLIALLLLVFLPGCAWHQAAYHNAAVATAHPLATQAALRTLDQGGNAFDAAIAAAAVLGVVEPYSAGLGGGGFWLLQKANGDTRVIDARETAPSAAGPSLYLDDQGAPRKDRPSLDGPLAAAIPGQPAALAYIGEHYGERPLSANLGEAIRIAELGFRVDANLRDRLRMRQDVMHRYAKGNSAFLDANGLLPSEGSILRQPQLAKTLQALAKSGHAGFYQGPVTEQLVQSVRSAGGIWTAEDLANYQVIEREPLRIQYGDAEVWTAPPPSSGGVAMAQMLGMLTLAPLPENADPIARMHHLTELMRRAYHDRAVYLGDPAFTEIPLQRLLSPAYLQQNSQRIDPFRATDNQQLDQGAVPIAPKQGNDTTHLSVVDQEGNRVSATLSINTNFGSGFVATSTGVLLNNEMDDFSIEPGHPNAYGLVGGSANAIAPGKRPLSSMTPTLIDTPTRSAILGTPGGSRIISMVFLATLDILAGRSAQEVVQQPRFHHQYLPDLLEFEPDSLSPEARFELEAHGQHLKETARPYGNMQLIVIDKTTGAVSAAADPRGFGQAIARPAR